MLEKSGYSATKLENISDLPTLAGEACGAVISLALTSSIEETAEEVFTRLRNAAPNMPILFAAMLDFSRASGVLKTLAENTGTNATIIDVNSTTENPAALGDKNTFLYVSRDGLTSTGLMPLVESALKKHFG